MKLSLKNIGKVAAADVEINGITVVAGANNTGKSTVGRTFFAVLDGYYNIEKQFRQERYKGIERAVMILLGRLGSQYAYRRFLDNDDIVGHFVKEMLSKRDKYKLDREAVRQEFLSTVLSKVQDSSANIDMEAVNRGILYIADILNITDEELLRSILWKKLTVEFSGQVSNIFSDAAGSICLQTDDRQITISINDDGISELKHTDGFLVSKKAVYIDDPFVIDEFAAGMHMRGYDGQQTDHRNQLIWSLFPDSSNGLVDEIVVNNKLKKVYEKISSVCEGTLISSDRSAVGYRQAGTNKILNAKNLSTGMKTFAVLKTLLENGTIESGGIIILDEPEIHLHPEWQLILAELVVLLYKEFDVRILLNTHSPYFLNAIEVYSAKYEAADYCKYYLASEKGNCSEIVDVSSQTELIYRGLAYPLQKLENERYQYD